jgi:signal transduction histidine kinase
MTERRPALRVGLRGRVAVACASLVIVGGVFLVLLVTVLAPRYLRENNDANRPAPPTAPTVPAGAPAPSAQQVAAQRAAQQAQVARQRAQDDDRKAAADKAFDDIRTVGFISVASLSVLAVGVAWVVAGRIVEPVRVMTDAARDISADTRLDRRLDLSGPEDELHELARSFDDMLDRLQSVFESQKSFTANASHELRTPLAVMQTEVDVALDSGGANPLVLRDALTAVGEELRRTTGVVDAMLALSRADTLATVQDADLAVLARATLDHLSPVERAQRDFQTDLQPAPVRGDPLLLARLLDNLVANASRYNRLEGIVRVVTGTSAGHARLVVENDGPVVDPASVPALFTRFVRRSDLGDGHGIGLSIVDAIVRTHGGTLEARARSQGGLSIEVSIPNRVT